MVITGWQRVGVMISILWGVLIFSVALYEKHCLLSGKPAFLGLALLQDKNSTRVFPITASLEKIDRLKELYMLKEDEEDEEARESLEKLMNMKVEPKLQKKPIGIWFFVPIATYWFFHFGIAWVVQGFRTSKT